MTNKVLMKNRSCNLTEDERLNINEKMTEGKEKGMGGRGEQGFNKGMVGRIQK